MVVIGAVLSFSCLLLNKLGLIPRLMLKTLFLFSFPFVLNIFRFYEPVELKSIRGFISKWSKIKNIKSNLSSLKGITDEL
jgi:hypothetical protein